MKKKFILISSIFLLSLLYFPGCDWIKGKKKDDIESNAVVTSKGKVVLDCSKLNSLIKLFEENDPKLKMLSFAPVEDQIKAYQELINRYVVTNFAVSKYIEETGINRKDSYKKEYKEYIEIMENQFNNGQLQKIINEEIVITESSAKDYYENNQNKFAMAPFAKEIPGSDIYIIPMEEGKSIKDYESKLKSQKDGQLVEKINESRGLPKEIFEAINSMKTGEMIEIVIGARMALYKVSTHKGEWHAYEKVAEQVKNMMRMIEIEKRYSEIVDNMKIKHDIQIDENCLREIFNKKQKEQSDFSLESKAEEVAKAMEDQEIMEKAQQAAEKVIETEINKEIESK